MSSTRIGFAHHRNSCSLERGPKGGTFRRRRQIRDVDTEGVRWVCVRVRSGREFVVADDMAAAGFRVFAPHGVRLNKRSRLGRNAAGGERRGKQERDFPVFATYLFIGEPAGLMVARGSHEDILAVVGSSDAGTQHIRSRLVEGLQTLWREGFWDYRVAKKRTRSSCGSKFQSGDEARFKSDDIFAGLHAIVEGLTSEEQAFIRFSLFGKEHVQPVDVDRLERV